MRRRAHTDSNQAEIVRVLRAAGASVQSLAAVGKGCPDLLVAYKGVNYLFEVKNPAGLNGLVARGKGLTPDQVEWHRLWRGTIHIVNNETEALTVIGAITGK